MLIQLCNCSWWGHVSRWQYETDHATAISVLAERNQWKASFQFQLQSRIMKMAYKPRNSGILESIVQN